MARRRPRARARRRAARRRPQGRTRSPPPGSLRREGRPRRRSGRRRPSARAGSPATRWPGAGGGGSRGAAPPRPRRVSPPPLPPAPRPAGRARRTSPRGGARPRGASRSGALPARTATSRRPDAPRRSPPARRRTRRSRPPRSGPPPPARSAGASSGRGTSRKARPVRGTRPLRSASRSLPRTRAPGGRTFSASTVPAAKTPSDHVRPSPRRPGPRTGTPGPGGRSASVPPGRSACGGRAARLRPPSPGRRRRRPGLAGRNGAAPRAARRRGGASPRPRRPRARALRPGRSPRRPSARPQAGGTARIPPGSRVGGTGLSSTSTSSRPSVPLRAVVAKTDSSGCPSAPRTRTRRPPGSPGSEREPSARNAPARRSRARVAPTAAMGLRLQEGGRPVTSPPRRTGPPGAGRAPGGRGTPGRQPDPPRRLGHVARRGGDGRRFHRDVHLEAVGGERVLDPLSPFDAGDAVLPPHLLEARVLEVRDPLEAVGVHVVEHERRRAGHGIGARDGERGAHHGDRAGQTEPGGDPLHQHGLPAAEIPVEGDDESGGRQREERGGEPAAQGLRLLRVVLCSHRAPHLVRPGPPGPAPAGSHRVPPSARAKWS